MYEHIVLYQILTPVYDRVFQVVSSFQIILSQFCMHFSFWTRDVSVLDSVETDYGPHPTSYPVGAGALPLGVK
jgi:hypothetical protein